MSKKDVAAKYGGPKKKNLSDSLAKGSSIKRQKLRIVNFEMVDKAK